MSFAVFNWYLNTCFKKKQKNIYLFEMITNSFKISVAVTTVDQNTIILLQSSNNVRLRAMIKHV